MTKPEEPRDNLEEPRDNLLVLMVGLPRAGKTTIVRQRGLFHNLPIVSPDAIRLALHGQRFIASAEPYVWAIARTMVAALFRADHSEVLVDATHGTRARRDFWKSSDWRRRFEVVDTPKEVCLDRARAAGDAEMLSVIERMAAAWEPVTAEENEP